MKIKALLVDDEPLARKRLRDLLKYENEIEIIGEARNGVEAVTLIKEKSPDLVFLDVQMPEMDGFDVIRTIGIEKMPHIVFITAYDQYALDAFDVHAIDYLLKPFSKKRFKDSLEKVIGYIRLKEKSEITDQLNKLLSGTGKKYIDRLIIKSGGCYSIIKTCDIDWIESSGNYLILHAEKEKHVIRGTISKME
ncbi:LytR/AlgR family response regulator transcription factor, partial [candidate division KSB1 bacterium]